jgi:excisionase family DNA binding protein
MEINTQDLYCIVLKDYPDILDVKQVSVILGVSTKTVYRLLRENTLKSLKVGREFRIPKVNVMKYVKIFGSTLYEQPTA